jgi:hypothetical protein
MILPDWAGYVRFRPQIAEALDPDFYPIEYVDQLLLAGQAQIFCSGHAAMIAELKHYPGGARVVHCLVAAGRMEEIVDDIRPRVEAWGIGNGCSRAMVESRSGWMKILRPHGYEPHQVSVIKSL